MSDFGLFWGNVIIHGVLNVWEDQKVKKPHLAIIPLIFVTSSFIFYYQTKAARWRWESSTHAEVNKVDARVWAHSWAGAMVTDNAALNDWRCMNRLPFPALSCNTEAHDRARHTHLMCLKAAPCLYCVCFTFLMKSRKENICNSERGAFRTCRFPLNCECLQDSLVIPDYSGR